DRTLPRRGDSARDDVRRHDRRDPRAGRARLPAAPVRPDALDPGPADAAPPPGRHRRPRGVQRATPARGVQRRGAPLRPQVQPHDGRRLRRARPTGGRNGRPAHARVSRRGGIPALAADGGGAEAAEIARLPAVAQVDGAGQGEGPLDAKGLRGLVTAAVTDEIYQRYLDKAIKEINRLHHEIAEAAGGGVAAQPTGHPLATIEALACPDIDASLDEQTAKTAFWNAFKPLGPWWAALPPY